MIDPRDHLRRTFDTAARLYETARPSYPNELFDDLVQLAGLSILAVGLCDPVEHLLPADDQADQRCEEKPVPDTEGDDGDGAYGRRLLSVATAYSEAASQFPQSARGPVRAECPVLARGAGQ